MQVWVNGRMLDDPTQPALRVDDHGFTVGDGVFEAVKVVDSAPFALTRHLDRLVQSAQAMGLPAPETDTIREGVAAVLAAEPLDWGRLRITVSGGPAPMGSGRADHPPTVVIAAGPMGPWEASTAIVTSPWPRNERGALAGVKTTSYAENVVALAQAHLSDATEAVFPNLRGHLCEGTGSNVFYVVDGELRTPTLASGCLAGVTRALILEWVGAREVDEPIEVAQTASEVFLASTTRDVQGVRRWDGRTYDAPGPVTSEALRVWREREADGIDP